MPSRGRRNPNAIVKPYKAGRDEVLKKAFK